MAKFRKKPVIIDAVQWTGANIQEISVFIGGAGAHLAPPGGAECAGCVFRFDYTVIPPVLTIPTLEGDHTAAVGDWIIRGVKGEYYPCKPDIFDATYEPVIG